MERFDFVEQAKNFVKDVVDENSSAEQKTDMLKAFLCGLYLGSVKSTESKSIEETTDYYNQLVKLGEHIKTGFADFKGEL